MKTLGDWLALVFPSMKTEVGTRVVVKVPEWTEADAANLTNFLETRTGQRMMDRMRVTATGMALTPEDGDVMFRATRRAFALVLHGIESLGDWDYFCKTSNRSRASFIAGNGDEDDN